MAGVLRKLQNNELYGYDDMLPIEDVYPVTSTQGVYHQFESGELFPNLNANDQMALEKILNNTAICNVEAWRTDNNNFYDAVASVPLKFRKPGFIIIYRDDRVTTNSGWRLMQFIGTTDAMVSTLWSNPNHWAVIGCNCTSGGGGTGPVEPGNFHTIYTGTLTGVNVDHSPTIGTIYPSADPVEGDVFIATLNNQLYQYYYTDKWNYSSVITAPQGVQGVQGPAGPKGSKGDTGPMGPATKMNVSVTEVGGGHTVVLKPEEGEPAEFTVYNGREVAMVGGESWTEIDPTKTTVDCNLYYEMGTPTSITAFRCYKVTINKNDWSRTPDDNGLYSVDHIDVGGLNLAEHMIEFSYWAEPKNYKICTDSFVFMAETENPFATLYCRNIPPENIVVIFKVFNNLNNPLQ